MTDTPATPAAPAPAAPATPVNTVLADSAKTAAQAAETAADAVVAKEGEKADSFLHKEWLKLEAEFHALVAKAGALFKAHV